MPESSLPYGVVIVTAFRFFKLCNVRRFRLLPHSLSATAFKSSSTTIFSFAHLPSDLSRAIPVLRPRASLSLHVIFATLPRQRFGEDFSLRNIRCVLSKRIWGIFSNLRDLWRAIF